LQIIAVITRDVYQHNEVTSGHCPEGTTERVDCRPRPEVPATLDMTIGTLGLTDQEENQIVAFLETLTVQASESGFPADIIAGET